MLVGLLHVFIVVSLSYILIFSNNLLVVFIATIITSFLYLLGLVYNGCILTEYEKGIPYIDTISNLMNIICCTNARTNDIEKIVLGIGLMGYLAKLSVLGLLHIYAKQSWLEFVTTHKSNSLIKFIPIF